MNTPPNILLITCDQLRWDTLGFQKRFPVRTPTIDALAREGVVFDQAYCAYPICVPSRASITTGRPCYDHGVYYNEMGWGEDIPTLPGTLSRNGYYSVAVGKMHFQPKSLHHGFDKRRADNEIHYHDYLAAHGIDNPHAHRPTPDGTPHHPDTILNTFQLADPGMPPEHYVTTYTTNEALDELDLIHQRRRTPPSGSEPFFMWLSYIKPHTPCDPPEPYGSMYDPDDLPPINRDAGELDRFPKQLQWYRSHWDVLNEHTIRKLRARYLGNISMIDDQLARVMQKLDELGLRESTIIVFSSDHGDYLGDHFCQQKSFFHDCSSRVPLIVSGAGVAGGRRVEDNCSHLDLTPTLLEAAKLARPGRRNPMGRPIGHHSDFSPALSLWPIVTGQSEGELRPDRIVFSESAIHGYSLMLKQGSTKINYYDDTHEVERFDLDKDPDELHGEVCKLTDAELPEDIRQTLAEVHAKAHRHSGGFYGDADWQQLFS